MPLLEAGLVTNDFVSKAFKVPIVRNPFDRAIVLFEYTSFDISCQYIEARDMEPIGLKNSDGLSQLNPQVKWLVDSSNNSFVDHIYHFETLADSWQDIWRRTRMTGAVPILPKLNNLSDWHTRNTGPRDNSASVSRRF
jgi:hypothetical protein